VPGKGEIMGRWMKKIKNKQYGQAMVEFALTLPIFLLAVIGVIELSRFFLVYSSVYTASREAARYGSAAGLVIRNGFEIERYRDCEGIKEVAVDTGFFGGVNTTNVNVYYEATPGSSRESCPSDVPLGYRLVVEAQADFTPLIAGFVLPDGITVSARNGRTIMKEIEILATPIPIPLCEDDIMFGGTLPVSQEPNNKTYTVKVKNVSQTAKYQLIEANIIAFNDKKELKTIKWNNVAVWQNTLGDEFPDIDPLSWEEVRDAEGNLVFSRFLSSEQTIPISFEFAKVINKSQLGLSFNLTFQNTSILTKKCTISWP
jgi:Flp pilus assembly protein TadG